MAAGEEGDRRGWHQLASWESRAMYLQDQRGRRSREAGRTAGMCFVMTAAAVLLEDLGEGLPHWERGKKEGQIYLTVIGNKNEKRVKNGVHEEELE